MQRPHPEIVCTSLSRNIKAIMSLSNRGWNLISSNFLQEESLRYHSKELPNPKKEEKQKLEGGKKNIYQFR